ncbi:MAG: UDP-N-acetylmuramate dehydrogenase [Bacteroidales bacterium]|nr:UDP-N-acetylmuramate dehydrogenase [Bacteroidales bacterium]MCM1147877.1 UDP-N-acetylmuramate dehydrogenase [Bacteroidales bacterium]MCM1206720.1 UDP-N-acetylmuramate dehydrogenase [Bacillota bacterium]MCM1510916.1 UDP-N-acetylmuramate dehydrogenase [Clostridium sp.]
MTDRRDYNLLGNNTFGISEECRRFIQFDSVEELRGVLSSLTAEDSPLLVIGGGSNLLFTKRFNGTVLRSGIRGIEVIEEDDSDSVLVRCGSGENFDDVVAYCVEHGYHGAENLSIIPGDVGASAVQNIGAYGCEAKDIVYTVEALDVFTGEDVSFANADCNYGYRQSRFKREWKGRYVITYVTYRLAKNFIPHLEYGNIVSELEKRGISVPTAKDVREVIIEIRNAKLPDPKVEGNAGSFFMNPVVSRERFLQLMDNYPSMPHYHVDDSHEKIPAGWLIEQCGWKGRGLSGGEPADGAVCKAAVHSKQALVLVNKGGATGKDIVALSNAIRKSVKEKFDIDIYPEVNCL